MKSERFEKKDSLLKIIFFYAVLTAMLIVTIFPLLDVLKISLRPYGSLFNASLKIIPDDASLENYRVVFFDKPFFTWLRNSFIVSALTSVLGVTVAFTAAYAFSRYKFKGKNVSMLSFLLTQIFPAPMLLLPTYILLRQFDLMNDFKGLIIPYVATAVPFSVWVLKGFFDTIPFSIEESAHMDGASLFQMLYKIVVPLSMPAIGVVALNSFMQAWSEYVIARIVLTSKDLHTLPVALVGLTGSFNTDWGIYCAASLVTAAPVMIVFMSFSKVLINGLTLGGVKG
ncbi:MAG: ABC transporter permease subunit [Clostridia bacterium]|nr:ABC transporter permease subunit [Clostridia bacterium]